MAEDSQTLTDLSELGEASGAVVAEAAAPAEPKIDPQGRAYAKPPRRRSRRSTPRDAPTPPASARMRWPASGSSRVPGGSW
jgi:hypothetical protein